MTFREYSEKYGSRFVMRKDNLTVYSDREELEHLTDWQVTRCEIGVTELIRII